MADLPAWYSRSADRYHLEHDGDVAVIRYAPGAGVKWRSDCDYCTRLTGDSDFFPSHGENSWCRNGRQSTHCTCDSCF